MVVSAAPVDLADEPDVAGDAVPVPLAVPGAIEFVVPVDGVSVEALGDGALVAGSRLVVDGAVDGFVSPAAEVPLLDPDVPGAVSAATANVAAVMPIVDTINPDTSLLFSRRIITCSCGRRLAASGCRERDRRCKESADDKWLIARAANGPAGRPDVRAM